MDAIVFTHFIDMPNLTTVELSSAFYYVSEKIVSSMQPSSRVTCRCRCVGSQQVPTVIPVILFVEKSTRPGGQKRAFFVHSKSTEPSQK